MAMKTYVPSRDLRDLAKDYPIADRLSGWIFRVTEVSASAYRAEGIDASGRRVAADNSDADVAVELCVAMAKSISKA